MNHDLDHDGINRRQFLGRVGATTLGASAVGVAGIRSSTQPANALVITGTTALLVGGAIAAQLAEPDSPTSLATKSSPFSDRVRTCLDTQERIL